MPDAIYKLQPHRTMHLQGFDDYGAAAALWGASDTGFTVSGVFRDMADFAVLVLFQKDDPFGHPLFSYLPDGDLTGLVLDFDVTWQGIQSWESLKNPWTDWNTLDYSINGVGHNDVKWFGIVRNHGHLQYDRPHRRVGHLHAQPEQPAARRQGHAVVSEPILHQPSDFCVAHNHRSGHVVAGQRRV